MADRVLVTGISGFIARHVALQLLEAGYSVHGTVRDMAKAEGVRQALAKAGGEISRLTFSAADLTDDRGWAEAMQGCRYVQHLASPFPMKQPPSRDGLVPAAQGGTLRVIGEALKQGAERIVLTSSIVAMMYRGGRPREFPIREEDWTDIGWERTNAYARSKTLAERAAWERVREAGDERRLAVVNPGLVLGPALDADTGTSLGVLELMLKGKYPAVPPIWFPVVDVRDVAAIHIRAMTLPEAGGRRLLAAGETVSMPQMAKVLRDRLGPEAHKVPRFALPPAMVRMIGLVDPSVRTIIPDLGVKPMAQSDYVTAMTGVRFRPAAEAVAAGGRSLIAHGVVRV